MKNNGDIWHITFPLREMMKIYFFMICFQGSRDESTTVDNEKAKADAKVQYVAWLNVFYRHCTSLFLCWVYS